MKFIRAVLLPLIIFAAAKIAAAETQAHILLVDVSGSMKPELDEIKKGCSEYARNLPSGDLLGIITFNSIPKALLALEARTELSVVLEAIQGMTTEGKTNLLPALDSARKLLKDAHAGRSHILLITDGEVPDYSVLYEDLFDHLSKSGITITAFFVGSAPSEEMKGLLSAEGKGRTLHFAPGGRKLRNQLLEDLKAN